MKKINRPLSLTRGVLFAQFVCPAKNVRPFNGGMNQNAVAQIFLNLLERELASRPLHVTKGHRVAQGVAHLHPVQRGERQRKSSAREEGTCSRLVRIGPMQRDEERRIGISLRFHS